MPGGSPEATPRVRRMDHARGTILLLVELLPLTGCASISEYLSSSIRPSPTTTVAREIDRDTDSRTVDRCSVPLLPATNRLHVVHAGETLSEIAVYYRILVSELQSLNPILDPDRIEVGQHLSLPSDAAVPNRPLTPRRNRPVRTRSEILMADAEAHYQAARFERALALSQEARTLMEQESDRNRQLARAAFVAGSALAGLGKDQRASEEFDRVHALDAHFEPPNGWLSPRLAVLYGDASAK